MPPANKNNGGQGDYMDPTQFPNEAPAGIQVAYVQTGGTLFQVTGTAAVVGQAYSLDVWVGTQNNVGPAGTFSIGLFSGNTAIATFAGLSTVNLYNEIKITGVATTTGNIGISLSAISNQTLFDDVKVMAVPEPSSLALGLLAAGTCGIFVRCRRKGVRPPPKVALVWSERNIQPPCPLALIQGRGGLFLLWKRRINFDHLDTTRVFGSTWVKDLQG